MYNTNFLYLKIYVIMACLCCSDFKISIRTKFTVNCYYIKSTSSSKDISKDVSMYMITRFPWQRGMPQIATFQRDMYIYCEPHLLQILKLQNVIPVATVTRSP